MQDRETALKEPCPHCGRTDYRWTDEFRVGLSKLEVRCDYCRPLRMDAYYYGFTETGVEAIDRILSAVAHAGKGYHHTESWGDEGLDDMGEFHGGNYVAWIQNAANDAAKALASPLSAPPQEPTGDSPQADVTCEHGTAMDVHCCNCHSGFIFDVNHECPSPELTWREAVEQALGVENDPENHTPSWAFDVVRAAREIGNAPTPASPQAEELRAANVANLREMVVMAGRHRETLLAVRECILALSPGHRTGYDWNADPLFLTLKEGRALNLIDDALKATPASPQAETPIQTLCKNCMQSERFIAPDGSTICHYCGFVQPAPVSPVEPTPEPETCAWKFDSDDSGMWETACGRFWEFNEDGPKENRVHFCFFCGKPLRLVPSEETK